MQTTTNVRLNVHPIDPDRLDAVRTAGVDVLGNPFTVHLASGEGEPLRCCLRFARPGERIALISWAQFDSVSPWTEVGPVYVHAARCDGPDEVDDLPTELRTGPRVLRTYRADRSMDYEHNTLVEEGQDLGPVLDDLLSAPGVEIVHVRTVLPQCFLYAVTR